MKSNRKISYIIIGIVCLMASVWGAFTFFPQRAMVDVETDYNKERAVHMVLKYHEMVQEGQIYEAFKIIPIFYKDEFSEVMASVRSSWSNPSPFEIEILEVNKINVNLYQVIVRMTHIFEEEYDNLQTVGDMYALFTNDEWVLVLNPHNIPEQYRDNLEIIRWDPNAIFPDEIVDIRLLD